MTSECPHHPLTAYRECHHVGDEYVSVRWDSGFNDWVSTYGYINRRGSMSAIASKELPYMLERLRASPTKCL